MNIKKYFKETIILLIKGLIMYFVVINLDRLIENKVQLIIIQVIVGVGIYSVLNYKYIMTLLKNILPNKFKEKIKLKNI